MCIGAGSNLILAPGVDFAVLLPGAVEGAVLRAVLRAVNLGLGRLLGPHVDGEDAEADQHRHDDNLQDNLEDDHREHHGRDDEPQQIDDAEERDEDAVRAAEGGDVLPCAAADEQCRDGNGNQQREEVGHEAREARELEEQHGHHQHRQQQSDGPRYGTERDARLVALFGATAVEEQPRIEPDAVVLHQHDHHEGDGTPQSAPEAP